MTEKIGIIKNPLTIIAIFAGIAEVSGTVVLPFVSEANQLPFIYFLIAFPSALVIIFFTTLNFNNKALYAPSDFTNEENYIKIFKYDFSKQEKVEVKVKTDEMFKLLNDNINEIKNINSEKLTKIETELKSLKPKETTEEFDDFEEIEFQSEPQISISNFRNAKKLLGLFRSKGYTAEIYESPDKDEAQSYSEYEKHEAFWLGRNVSMQMAKNVIGLAKKQYPHLKYIDISDNDPNIPFFIHDSIYVGGATETAEESGLIPLSQSDFDRIEKASNIKEIHKIIREFK